METMIKAKIRKPIIPPTMPTGEFSFCGDDENVPPMRAPVELPVPPTG
jgi:hypothetical protein